jgi:hypothetical protein
VRTVIARISEDRLPFLRTVVVLTIRSRSSPLVPTRGDGEEITAEMTRVSLAAFARGKLPAKPGLEVSAPRLGWARNGERRQPAANTSAVARRMMTPVPLSIPGLPGSVAPERDAETGARGGKLRPHARNAQAQFACRS